MTNAAPETPDQLREAVLRQFEELSPRFQQVARHLLDEPNDFAFETLATVASKTGAQPSTIVRFAQQFGFNGAAPMQRLLRKSLLRQAEPIGYSERLRQFSQDLPTTEMRDPGQLLAEFVRGNVHALEHLSHAVGKKDLVEAVDMIEAADTVFVVGFRRAFPVASYLAYLLAQAGKRLVLVDGIAGLAQLQMQGASSDDLVVAISFAPYAAETVALVESVAARSVGVLAISDSVVSPIGRDAALVLQVRETEVRGFRSIAASMALVQTLAIFHGLRRTEANDPA